MTEEEIAETDSAYAAYIEHNKRLDLIPKPAGMQVTIKYGVDGPPDDPYHVAIFEVRMPDGNRIMLRSAEFTPSLVIESDAGRIEFTSEYQSTPSHEEMFESYVGFTLEQLIHWDSAEQELYAEIREAELAAGWDPSP